MSGDILHRLLLTCHHQFSWPRRSETGEYYQLCVNCGIRYRYDWARMRRLSRLGDEPETIDKHRKCGTKTAWTPRERRLRHNVPVFIRTTASPDWIEAKSENVSRSGLLSRCETLLETGTTIEIRLEMPKEITGEVAEVICEASVARVVPAESRKNSQTFLIACAIHDYRFVEQSNLPIAG
jgi:RNase P subunit RPR2